MNARFSLNLFTMGFGLAGMPWWQVIAASAVVLRTLVFPLVIIAQKNMVVINNNQVNVFNMSWTEGGRDL